MRADGREKISRKKEQQKKKKKRRRSKSAARYGKKRRRAAVFARVFYYPSLTARRPCSPQGIVRFRRDNRRNFVYETTGWTVRVYFARSPKGLRTAECGRTRYLAGCPVSCKRCVNAVGRAARRRPPPRTKRRRRRRRQPVLRNERARRRGGGPVMNGPGEHWMPATGSDPGATQPVISNNSTRGPPYPSCPTGAAAQPKTHARAQHTRQTKRWWFCFSIIRSVFH